MKKIRVAILTLVLSISMLAPEFSMLPAVYADDGAPAVEQSADGAEAVETPKIAKNRQAQASSNVAVEAPETAKNRQANNNNGALTAAPSSDPGEAGVGAPGSGQDAAKPVGATDPTADPATATDPAVDPAASTDPEAGTADPAEKEDPADPAEPADKVTSYDMFQIKKLCEAKELTIPEEMQDKIAVEPAEYGDGMLFTGKVGDLNSTYITFENAFNFDAGSVGRLYIDGLKDKDVGMTVEVEVYLDSSKSPIVTVPLKKQMGKKEWANKGDKSVSLGTSEISGKHTVALKLKISGKGEKKNTTVMLRSIQFCKTTLPVMYVNIDESEGTVEAMNNSEDHSVECYGNVDLVVPDAFNADKTFRDEYGEQESLYGLQLEYIRGRGNSTWMDDKKPYKVKFDKAQDLFGFGKNKHWVLIANRYDNSLVRNRMTYWLGQQLGMEYTPQCVPVELVMNGEFYGSYLLCEQIRVGEGRVTIDDLDDQDPLAVTDDFLNKGCFLLSMDGYSEEEKRMFKTENGMEFYIESPDKTVSSYYEYIKAYIQKVENAIYGDDFRDAEGKLYTEYLDLDAAVDYWWIQEFSSNGDAYSNGSTYLYKKKTDDTPARLYWGPLWDFDFVAWGDLDYEIDPQDSLDSTFAAWFDMMKADPVFIKASKDRWLEEGGIRDKIVEITEEGGRLDKYLAQMETSYTYDHDKWGPYESEFTKYKDEIEQLRSWINKRLAFVDEEVKKLSTDPYHVRFTVDGKVVKEVDVIGALRPKDFPKDPEKPGYVFSSWVDEDGVAYEEGSRIMENITLSAFFMDEGEIIQPKDIFFRQYEVYYPVYPDDDLTSTWYSQDYRVFPEDAFDTDLTWSSSNEEVATNPEGNDLIKINGFGDTTITAKLANGVSRSYKLHVVKYEDMNEWEETALDKESITLNTGGYTQIRTISSPKPCDEPEIIWISVDENVAYVNDIGVVTAVGPGTTDVLAVITLSNTVLRCKVTVKDGNTPANYTGRTVKRNGSTYKITSDKAGSRTAMLVKAKNAKTVTIPATVKFGGRTYSVNKIKSKAFAKSKATKLIVKTKKLSKARVKGSLKKSKVTSIKVKVGRKKLNRKYVKKYKKYFTKKNAGKRVKVY
ncbi:MAG: CotH kinase family protein [Lachnospiraceae bacterium]|nr:CotH kinase family protein [Lachnospiraceae bacterium]